MKRCDWGLVISTQGFGSVFWVESVVIRFYVPAGVSCRWPCSNHKFVLNSNLCVLLFLE
jgi:hypothetical protein